VLYLAGSQSSLPHASQSAADPTACPILFVAMATGSGHPLQPVDGVKFTVCAVPAYSTLSMLK